MPGSLARTRRVYGKTFLHDTASGCTHRTLHAPGNGSIGSELRVASKIANPSIPADNISMIVGTGVDIAEVGRIRASIARYGERFLRRIFTDGRFAIANPRPAASRAMPLDSLPRKQA